MEIGGDLADKNLYNWKSVAIEGFMRNLIGNRGQMEYLQQISKGEFIISSCMMRQHPLFLLHDATRR